MTEQNVPILRTPVDMQSYANALALAWRSELGALPTKEQMGVLWAQYGIETGAGSNAACWNNNLGNVKHVAGDGYDYIMLPGTWEMIGGKRVVFQPPSPATWFRAYPSLAAGMQEHFRFLRSKRYAPAWPGVEAGDCTLFATKLKAAGYFTADATAYANGMLVHFRRWMASDAYDNAIAAVDDHDEEQPPELPANDFEIVHPAVDLEPPEPPEAA